MLLLLVPGALSGFDVATAGTLAGGLRGGDILVVAQKVVSKAEDRFDGVLTFSESAVVAVARTVLGPALSDAEMVFSAFGSHTTMSASAINRASRSPMALATAPPTRVIVVVPAPPAGLGVHATLAEVSGTLAAHFGRILPSSPRPTQP